MSLLCRYRQRIDLENKVKELKRSVKVAEGCCSVIVVLCIVHVQFDNSALCLLEVLHLFCFAGFAIERNLARKGMVFKSELKARKRILKKLGYCRFFINLFSVFAFYIVFVIIAIIISCSEHGSC